MREPDLHFENAWAGAPKSCLGPALVTQQRSFLIGMSQGNDAIEKIARIKLPLVTHFGLFNAAIFCLEILIMGRIIKFYGDEASSFVCPARRVKSRECVRSGARLDGRV